MFHPDNLSELAKLRRRKLLEEAKKNELIWQQPFRVTAVLLTMLQAAGTGIGIWCLSEAIRARALRRAEIVSTVREHRVNGAM